MGWHRGRVSSLKMGSCVSQTKLLKWSNKVGEDPATRVITTCGTVEGKKVVVNGFESHCFLGVPYAKPPLDNLRFRKPEPPEPWVGVRQCTEFGNRSVQKDMIWDKVTISTPQSEDCLYLNIFAPAISPGKKYPVLFYIHGGGWMMDSAVRYTPKNLTRLLVSKGIVVVTIQYRLGYLGFLCTGDDAAKGNFGLWDQLQALKWTRENIAAFGGDPEHLTIGGQSAGGVSTDLLSMSPHTRGMFKQKLVLGANSYCHWAVTPTEQIRDYCRKKAYKLGWKERPEGYATKLEENEDMVEYLRTIPAKKFGTHMIGCHEFFSEARLPLAPVIDGDLLPYSTSRMRAEAPAVPSIVGVGEQESLLFIALGGIRCTGKDISKVVNVLGKKTKSLSTNEIQLIVDNLYKAEVAKTPANQTKEKYVTLTSDIISNYACWRYMSHSQTHNQPCYAYSFDYTSRRMWGWLVMAIPFMAGTHTSEVIYLFDCNYLSAPLAMDKTDRTVSENTARWFADFIITGNPNSNSNLPTWEPIPKDGDLKMFSISEEPHVKENIFGNRMKKLDEMFTATTFFSARSAKSSSSTLQSELETIAAER